MAKRLFIFIVFGPSGVGKTQTAKTLSRHFKIKIFSTDQIRRQAKFKAKADHYQKNGIFFPKNLRQQFYRTLIKHGEREIKNGKSVILDATFHDDWTWAMAQKLAKTTKAQLVPIEVFYRNIKPTEIQKRLTKRYQKDPQAALPEIYWAYQKKFKPPKIERYRLNNDGNKAALKNQIQKIIKQLKDT